MNFKEFQIFFKYLYNRINYDDFASIIAKEYGANHEAYITEEWESFQHNMIAYVGSREQVFNNISKRIKDANYKG